MDDLMAVLLVVWKVGKMVVGSVDLTVFGLVEMLAVVKADVLVSKMAVSKELK